jgi:hypothetical protein
MGAKLGLSTLKEEYRMRVVRIFGTKREEVTGTWIRLHQELHNLYASPNVITGIKSRTMRWAGHIARFGEMWSAYNILVGKPDHLEDLSVDGRIKVECTLGQQGGKVWRTGCSCLRTRTGGRLL